MKKALLIQLMTVMVLSSGEAQTEGRFVLLFNGRDLSQWILGEEGGFEVKDGEIYTSAYREGSHLFSKNTYTNYILRLEFLLSERGNSGLLIRCDPEDAWTTGVEVQLLSARTPLRDELHCTGSLYGHAAVMNRPDETAGIWHQMEIHCDRRVITVSVDGQMVPRVDTDTVESMKDKVCPLAQDYVEVFRSPDPERIYPYSPGITRLESGRLVATLDIGGPGMKDWPEKPVGTRYGSIKQGKVFTSDDNGKTWSKPVKLTEDEDWTQAPCNVHYAHGCIYLLMHKRPYPHKGIWPVSVEAPVLMRGRIGSDLTRAENWTFASELVFRDVVQPEDLDYFGVPFFESKYDQSYQVSPGRGMSPIGWLEGNVVRIHNPNHIWYDPAGQTFHLWMRAHTGGTGYAAIARVVEHGEQPGTGPMTTMLETVPSGKTMLYVPCPGGQMRFHVLYDEQTGLYWLLSTQATDSMIRPDRLPGDRYNLPNNERRRLQLHFSKNMIDWQFAGLVAKGPANNASRHYASMVIDGDDLHVLSRSGDLHAKSAHDGNIITFHTIEDFRKLVY